MARLWPPRDPVSLDFDGAATVAERGEPIAAALIGAGHVALARSPKFHRPRGPSCFRAACDGCLARVDGIPNVMTCRVPAGEGMRIETQNVVGSRETDLLRAADWFFPEGMNHHELLAGVPGVQRAMQSFARRVAGLGKLPSAPAPHDSEPIAERRTADVLVVGAGPSGMAAALELVRRGRRVEVVDDALEWGGGVRAMTGDPALVWAPLCKAFADAVATSRIAVRQKTTAAGVYGDEVLIAGQGSVQLVVPRTLVLAPGAHDGVLAFEGNDVPGVMSARAAGWLLGRGIVVGKRVVVAVVDGGGPFGESYARIAPQAVVARGMPVRVRGSARVKEATITTREGLRSFACDTLLVDAPRAPAYEVCAQAGARLIHHARGFVVEVTRGGRVRDGVFAIGEVVGTPLEPGAIAREATALDV